MICSLKFNGKKYIKEIRGYRLNLILRRKLKYSAIIPIIHQ
ncbi:hypothetical protein HMPREF9065_01465 [Aggregatibacter sp. oral taxon 458 str. W10330]|nr:hypothetical protein HMPREF9065_01465 [Aggregatibacter sp. oral taxon 458 str. W10330]